MNVTSLKALFSRDCFPFREGEEPAYRAMIDIEAQEVYPRFLPVNIDRKRDHARTLVQELLGYDGQFLPDSPGRVVDGWRVHIDEYSGAPDGVRARLGIAHQFGSAPVLAVKLRFAGPEYDVRTVAGRLDSWDWAREDLWLSAKYVSQKDQYAL